MRRLIFMAVAWTACAHARANLDEMPAQVEARYGAGTEVAARAEYLARDRNFKRAINVREFSHEGYKIFVTFDTGRSVSETFARLDGKPLGENEIAAFLKQNDFGQKWQEQQVDASAALQVIQKTTDAKTRDALRDSMVMRQWKLGDSLCATYYGGGTLVVETSASHVFRKGPIITL
ncbi:MAG TPA: hypothetical protein VG733_00530 [Chthoniobacteraceae bacterium]|nr:hypothetical protein [Chthoniobacteraceae bacterium]